MASATPSAMHTTESVWVLMGYVDYEGGTLLGAYSSLRTARYAARMLRRQDPHRFHHIYAYRVRVGGAPTEMSGGPPRHPDASAPPIVDVGAGR